MEKSTAFLLALCLACTPIAQAQLSGEVSLGGASADQAQEEKQGNPQTNEITVTGIGTTLESAEKQALASAIRQAVGAYMDSKTIIENEEVIQDRILSVSNAFIEKYELIGQPKKSSDGLIEIIILAKVKTNQVVQALKEQNLISGEVAGQNLWAEASTKVMNAQDGVAMLEAKIPEFIKNSVTITPLGKDGKPQFVKDASGNEVPSTAPAIVSEDAATGKAQLRWFFAIGMDSKYYKAQILPTIIKCFDAISGTTGIEKEMRFSPRLTDWIIDSRKQDAKVVKLPIVQLTQKPGNGRELTIIKSISKTFDSCKYIYYNNAKIYFETYADAHQQYVESSRIFLKVELYDLNDDLIASDKIKCWHPFQFSSQFSSDFMYTGPMFNTGMNNLCALPFPIGADIEMPIALLKEIKQVKVSLEVPPIKVALKSANER
jgi:hypothetical protein